VIKSCLSLKEIIYSYFLVKSGGLISWEEKWGFNPNNYLDFKSFGIILHKR